MDDGASVLEIANFAVSTVTAVCALYIAYVSLAHSAKPHGVVTLGRPLRLHAGEEADVRFAFRNTGHWYAKPPIVELDAWMNFDPAFELQLIRFGSALEIEDRTVRTGKGEMKFLKAKGLKLAFGGGDESVVVRVRAPSKAGRYLIKVDAFSENGAAIKGRWMVQVRQSASEAGRRQAASP